MRPGVLQEYLGLKKVIWFWRGICGDDAVVNGCAPRLPPQRTHPERSAWGNFALTETAHASGQECCLLSSEHGCLHLAASPCQEAEADQLAHCTRRHVDNFCCFAEPGKVMLAWTDDEMDPQVWTSSNLFESAKLNRLCLVIVYSPLHCSCCALPSWGLVARSILYEAGCYTLGKMPCSHLTALTAFTRGDPTVGGVQPRAGGAEQHAGRAGSAHRGVQDPAAAAAVPQLPRGRRPGGASRFDKTLLSLHPVSPAISSGFSSLVVQCAAAHPSPWMDFPAGDCRLACWVRYAPPVRTMAHDVCNHISSQPDHIEKGYVPRIAGERLPATYINHYTANGELTGLTQCHHLHLICRLCQQAASLKCLLCPAAVS